MIKRFLKDSMDLMVCFKAGAKVGKKLFRQD